MNLSRLRLITFDVTNTLLQFRSTPGKQYGEIGALYGVLCDNHLLSSNFKEQWKKMNEEHPNFGLKTGLGWEQWWKNIVHGTFKHSNFNLDDNKLDAIASHLISVYQTSTCWQQCYGAFGLLSYLRNRGVPVGIISNSDPRLSEILINTKLRHYFHFVVTSYEAGVEKPHPQIFEEAMNNSKLQKLKPDECLHVGDTVALDYMGAKNCGWHPVLISDTSADDIKAKHPEVHDNHIFQNLYELHKHFLQKNSTKLSAQSY